MTAIAVMQLQEQGLVDLDAPASDYLRACQLVSAKASLRPAAAPEDRLGIITPVDPR